jgi:sortase A
VFSALSKRGRLLVACLLGFGFLALGQGAYIPAKAWLAQDLMLRAWSRMQSGETRVTPWPWADTWPIARLTARAGDVDLIVLAGGSGRTLAFGPGHLGASVLPGEIGNAVIAGHRDTHFLFLKDLQAGEVLKLESGRGLEHSYEVIGVDIVDSRKDSLSLDTDAAMLSLVTCYPFDTPEAGGPLRYVVTARMLY